VPVDIQKLFNDKLPAALAKNADDAKGIGATFQLDITGAGGGKWFVDVSASGPSCTAGERPADCTVTLAEEDFQKLLENPQANAMQLFFSGKLKLAGNTMLAMKLTKLLGYMA
jgi:putative sterol carrier protein